MHQPLKGVIPPMVTPLKSYDQPDHAGLERLIEHLISGGVHGIFILGTNGEASSLSLQVKKEITDLAAKRINHRVPLLVGISDTSLEHSLEVAHMAKKAGADALVVSPPYYFPLDQEDVYQYYKYLSKHLPLPFFIYNIPGYTKVPLEITTIIKIKELGALGIKDSTGDQFSFYKLLDTFRDSPDFSLITGTEMFLSDVVLNGGHGAVPGGANIFPGLFVRLYEAAEKKDLETISVLREIVMEIYNTIYEVSSHPAGIPAGIKCALSVLGICQNYMAPPLQKISPAGYEQVEQHLNRITQKINTYI